MGDHESRDRRKQHGRATAGPSADDRFGPGLVGTNMQSRILAVTVDNDRTRVTMSRGKNHGVHVGMEGYIKAAGGMLSELQIDAVEERRCHAFVDVTPDELKNHLYAIINPTAMPKRVIDKEVGARVIGVSVEGGRTKITIAQGGTHGVTAGMRGHLAGPDGREGADFTIEGTTARQSFAFVASTVDHVHQHPTAVLHPARSRPAAPIQRRANGHGASMDVQATAQAGVAGADRRLPHFDTIQRAFGKHDISGVRAQVGGAATSATSSLGAQAYATGDKVAFASAPDLHTAAHEAAHVVQQREGVVSFKGVGPADDAHERHADQVADKVVAGESAESLIDEVVGAVPRASVVVAEPGRSIQRRAAHPLDNDATPMKAESVGAKEIPIYEHERPHKLDGEVAVAVFLRRIYEKAHLDDGLKGDARKQKVVFAADEASELVKEIVRLTSLDKKKVNWEHVDTELVHALRAMHRVETEAPALEKKRIGSAMSDLERLVDKKVFAGVAKALPGEDVLPAMNEKERLEMAAQAIIGACREAALFAKRSEGNVVEMKSAREHFTQMRLHYEAATDAMRGIKTGLVLRLDSDIELATKGMGNSEQLISVAGLPWDRTFAAAFDAEFRFLTEIGGERKFLKEPRKYSGNIDPNKAIKQIDEIASGGASKKWSDKKFENPAQAVTGIGVLLDEVFVRQQTAVKNATAHIAEPRIPKEQGMLSTLLEILIKTALAGAAGAIGTKIASMAKGRLERALSEKAMSSSMFSPSPAAGDYFKSRDILLKDAIGSGAASTTLRSEMAKDAAKELFKSAGYKAIMAAIAGKGKPSSNSSNPLHIFQEHAEGVLQDARVEGRIAFAHLAPALGQAQPEPLYELYQALLHQLPEYYSIQYNFVMEEWQNFKARMHYGVASDDSPNDKQVYDEQDARSSEDRAADRAAPKHDMYSGSDANVGNELRDGERGALLIDASVITDDFVGEPGSFRISRVRLPDAEDATLRHFRRDGKKLADVHMNKHYRLKFVMYMTEHEVNIGVGADHGFLESTLDKHEMTVLRVAAAGDRVTNTNYLVAHRGGDPRYDHFTERQLQKYLERYIRKIEQLATTRSLER